MKYAFAPQAPSIVGIAGSDECFPVRRIYCVGLNYAEHVLEMGFDRQPPLFFAKPADALIYVPDGSTGSVPYPSQTSDYQYEIELVVAIGKAGSDIAVADAGSHVFGYAIGLDMTRRDLQAQAREQGRPWEPSKSFDQSAPIGPIHPAADAGRMAAGAIWLDVNGKRQQSSDLSKLIWNLDETIAHLSRYFALQPGDLIFSGTPEGVGPVVRGDLMVGGVEELGELRTRVC